MKMLGVLALGLALSFSAAASGLRAGAFDIDVTPPIGAPLAYGSTERHWDLGLRAKGLVLLGADAPIVLCGIDWIGISNEGFDAFREALAEGAGTTPDRVAIQALHQHDAPICDFSTERILQAHGLVTGRYDGEFARSVLPRLTEAVRAAVEASRPVTHVGAAEAEVFEVASNRRLLGEDGTVRAMRFTATADPDLRAEPEGLIDPMVSVVSLWNEDAPIAVLSYYAVHPQSYYRTNTPNPDFPGVARFLRQLAVPQALHIHFTGAAGDIGAGKYNDGSHENRFLLAERLADGMRRAWEATEPVPITAEAVQWRVAPVMLPPAGHMDAAAFRETLANATGDEPFFGAATKLAWLERIEAGIPTELTSLVLGPAQLLHLPAESFVAYQLAAKELQPERVVGVAAYGDYGAAYICTEEAYAQGGYEASDRASNVAPGVEAVMMEAIRELMAPAADSPLPHAVFLVSEDPHNYEAHATIPPFAEMLEREHGFRATVLQREGEDNAYSFSGLDTLASADVLVVFVRRTCLPAGEMAMIRAHIEAGKPLIGIRTANHAFSIREADGAVPEDHEDWWDFVPDVLGCENRGYGPVEPGTAVSTPEGGESHPILEGIASAWHSPGNVYRVAPLVDEEATVLLKGRVEGEDSIEPIAWTRTTPHGGMVFYTSLGHPGDFDDGHLPRLLVNALHWCVGSER